MLDVARWVRRIRTLGARIPDVGTRRDAYSAAAGTSYESGMLFCQIVGGRRLAASGRHGRAHREAPRGRSSIFCRTFLANAGGGTQRAGERVCRRLDAPDVEGSGAAIDRLHHSCDAGALQGDGRSGAGPPRSRHRPGSGLRKYARLQPTTVAARRRAGRQGSVAHLQVCITRIPSDARQRSAGRCTRPPRGSLQVASLIVVFPSSRSRRRCRSRRRGGAAKLLGVLGRAPFTSLSRHDPWHSFTAHRKNRPLDAGTNPAKEAAGRLVLEPGHRA